MKQRILLVLLGLTTVVAGAAWYLRGHSIAVLQPKGTIASDERELMVLAALLSVIVVIPVFILLFVFAWRYRENAHPRTAYRPNWDHNPALETAWWLIPTAIIFVLSIVTWRSSHSLDPFRPIATTSRTEIVQVVALQWKWLFIYPEHGVASVNQLYMPVGRPVSFQITSDAPMNSFWIPSLGGQMYAMAGMNTQLNLRADEAGTYRGSSANISGDQFADMHFAVSALPSNEYDKALASLTAKGSQLTVASYTTLAKPSVVKSNLHYGKIDAGLYDWVIMKYMTPLSGAMPAGHGHGAEL
jgi:cytochrome o ubiquinol oxidase subunit 2